VYGRIGRIHMIGIGGSGMSGIAEVLINMGYEVSGSDLHRTPVTDRLVSLGARIAEGHRAELVRDAAVVVASTAVRDTNPEVEEARRLKIPVIARAEMLAELMRMKHGIAVAGAHGKTTTTSLVASVLAAGGLDPTVVVGGRVRALGTSARLGTGDFLVAEADESDGSFLRLSPAIAVITNIDLEHLDHWTGGIAEIQDAFVEFANKVPFYGLCVACVEDPRVREVLPRLDRRVATYAATRPAHFRVDDVRTHDDYSTTFDVFEKDFLLGRARIRMPGRHNALNALAAVAVGRELDLGAPVVLGALEAFEGVSRRFEIKGEESGVMVVDDYGHHPSEIRAVLRAAKEHGEHRVVALFQPHRYTRTRDLMAEFGGAFADADEVFVTSIYAAGEDPLEGVGAEGIVEAIRRSGHPACRLVPDPADLPEAVRPGLRAGDVVITLGAGNIYRAGEALLTELASHGAGAAAS
jgi:UDP-N-acetylmuramate--alanine ligase